MRTSSFTWGDTVHVKADAPSEFRAGEYGDIVAITEIDTQTKVDLYGVPLGNTVYQIEFGDGEAVEIPETWLDADPNGRRPDPSHARVDPSDSD